MIHGKNILLLLPSKALLCEVHTGIIRGRCQPRILVFTRMQIRFLWFCRYVVLDMALDEATKGERSRHDFPVRYQLVKDCRINSSFFT